MLTRMTRMARMLTHMLTRMTRWLAYYTHSMHSSPDPPKNLFHSSKDYPYCIGFPVFFVEVKTQNTSYF